MDWSALLAGSPWALAVLILVAMVRGWLVPQKTVERELQAADRRAEDYKAAWQAADARADAQADYLRELLDIGRTSASALEALRAAAQKDPA